MSEQRNSDFLDYHENLWPSGWYLYEAGQFIGPLNAEEAFCDRGATPDGKPRLISRKGFAQWYPVQDLASIYMTTATVAEKSQARMLQAQKELRSEAPGYGEQTSRSHRVQQKAIDPRAAKTRSSGKPSSMVPPHSQAKPVPAAKAKDPEPEKVVAPPAAPAPSKAATKAAAKAAKKAAAEAAKKVAAEAATKAAAEAAKKAAAKSKATLSSQDTAAKTADASSAKVASQAEPQKLSGKAALMHEYFILKGRMRLGPLRNPWVSGFFNTVATLGVYWFVWFGAAYKEVSWHCQNRDKFSMPPRILCLIPIVHFFMIYRLAKLVGEMEQQNKYQTVSPTMAVIYGVFPPFAVTYLQDAINRHWLLHVRHSLARKQG